MTRTERDCLFLKDYGLLKKDYNAEAEIVLRPCERWLDSHQANLFEARVMYLWGFCSVTV